jgi:hypothetical protein
LLRKGDSCKRRAARKAATHWRGWRKPS